MLGQNIKNYYFNRSDIRLSNIGNYDITLSSDNLKYNSEVVFSKKLIGEEDGNVLPINIDLNSVLSNQKLELLWDNYYTGNTLLSKNYYNPNNESFDCLTATSLCDIGLTAIDTGLYDSMTGETITFTMGINDDEMFNPHYYDRRFKMHPVGTYAKNPNHRFSGNTATVYNIVSDSDCHAGYYHELYGGFYQGFYKLHGYDYEVFPERVPKGWTMEALLKPRQRDKYEITSNETYLNDVYSGNSGTFFFFGARAENKFFHPADGEVDKSEGFGCKTCNISVGFQGSDVIDCDYERITTGLTDCIKTCACSDTGVTSSNCIDVYPKTATTQVHQTGSCGSYTEEVEVKLDLPSNDMYSNALSVRFSGDPANPKICVKYISLSGNCVTSGTCETSGLTYCSGYTVNEVCSSAGIYDLCEYGTTCEMSGTTERWVMISAVFERYETLEDCDLLNWGGLGDIRYLAYDSELNGASYNMIMPPFTHPGSEKEIQNQYIRFNQKWIDNTDKRKGLLKIYVNGFLFMVIEDFEEIIPHELNTEKEKQLGVPYNISFGGGTQGLRESLIFSGCSGLTGPYIQDPELMSNESLENVDDPSIVSINSKMVMEPNFGGTFMGGISQFRMYAKSLTSPEIQHNFRILKDRYNLFDFWCPNCSSCFCGVDVELDLNPTPSITPTNTLTPTPSVTPTNTVTPTISDTPSPSNTPGVSTTPTSTVTPTNTVTPTLTVTPTITPTNTVTPTLTVTPTNTQTPTNTITPTNTQTPTLTPTNTLTPTPSSSETFFILFENSDIMTSENGDGIEYEHHITPSITTTSSITPTPTPSITSTITPTPSVTPINPVSGMIFYYDPGNTSSYNGSGTVLSDLSGNGNDATIFGGPSYTSGNGGYFSFDGTDDYILSPNIYDGSNENHTVEVWVYLTSVNECLWGDNGQSTPNLNYHFAGSQVLQVGPFQQVISALWGGTATSRGVNGSGSLLNGWNQVVRVYNGTTITPYLNGVVGSTETVSFDSPYDDGLTDWYLAFGHEDTTTYNGTTANFFSGRYGVIRYYNTTLNSSQILQNFNSDRGKYGL